MKIWYYLRNLGDGTGAPMFCDSERLAEIMEDYDVETSGEGWGDGTVGYLSIKSTCTVFPDYDYTVETAVTAVNEYLEDFPDSQAASDALEALQVLR